MSLLAISTQDAIDALLFTLLLNALVALVVAVTRLVEEVRRTARARGVRWWQL